MKINFLDLFSGVGGFHHALELSKLNIQTAVEYRSEIEPYADKVYQNNFPFSRNLGDITKIDGVAIRNKHPGEWLITGGFPCQDISYIGKGKGLDGERSGLWWHYWRLIRDIQPRWVVAENVPALNNRGLFAVLKSLAIIGYNAEWRIISADSYGAPHRRQRLWIVAYPTKTTQNGCEPYKPPQYGMVKSKQQHGDTSGIRLDDDNRPTSTFDRVEFWSERLRATTEGKISSTPGICRMDDGVSAPVHRTAALGNAIVPIIAAEIIDALLLL